MPSIEALGAESAIAQPSFQQPHTLIFFIAALVCLGVALIPLFNTKAVSTQRRMYWGGTAAAAVCFFLASLPDVVTGVLLVVGSFVFMAIPAYFSGPLIKVGEKVIAFHLEDSRTGRADLPGGGGAEYEPSSDSYGGSVTAAKMWWLLIFAVGLCASTVFQYIVDTEKPWIVVLSTIAIFAFSILYGFGDGSWGHRIARGQYVQFGIIAILTAGVFTLLYLAAYLIARRWPWRRQDSLENLHRSRHQK